MDEIRTRSTLARDGEFRAESQSERPLVTGPSSADVLAGALLGVLVGFMFVVLGQADGVGAGAVAAGVFGSLGVAHWLRGGRSG